MENGIARAHWAGKVPTSPDETSPAAPDLTVPSDEKSEQTVHDKNLSADHTTVDIPKTAGSVYPAAAGAAAMLAFSAVVFLRRKNTRLNKGFKRN